jgi:hypothetical protein
MQWKREKCGIFPKQRKLEVEGIFKAILLFTGRCYEKREL